MPSINIQSLDVAIVPSVTGLFIYSSEKSNGRKEQDH